MTPVIDKPVRGSKSGRPLMVVLDLLGRRTTLRILWELQSGSLTFRALLDACETNTRLLNIRLGELREMGLVDHAEGGYRLTEEGRKLGSALKPLTQWADQWGHRMRDQTKADAAASDSAD